MKPEFKFKDVIFHSSHVNLGRFPENPTMPQIAFSGRSNAGKSSLINSITNKKSLVRVSATPGKTKEINLFLADKHLFLVDLPGFGYAKASHDIRDAMTSMIMEYLNNAKTLELLFVLCDSERKVPLEELNMLKTCVKRKINCLLIRTKFDKLNQKGKNILSLESEKIQKQFPCR
ncbi:MAG: ribosome biogenesis GTP-binding protein YihA/YsxC [Leptospira sp.]|nr:ribosome biogenesis GTP-binding protein YihA/YsxC [Leptospira sp.]